MIGADAIVRCLEEEGVEYVFRSEERRVGKECM